MRTDGFQTRNVALKRIHDFLSYREIADTKSFGERGSKSCSRAVRVDVHIRNEAQQSR